MELDMQPPLIQNYLQRLEQHTVLLVGFKFPVSLIDAQLVLEELPLAH
jgi:hypothetical protein